MAGVHRACSSHRRPCWRPCALLLLLGEQHWQATYMAKEKYARVAPPGGGATPAAALCVRAELGMRLSLSLIHI